MLAQISFFWLTGLALGQSSQPFPCIRWAGQAAISARTLFYYGGQATLQPTQSSNTWTNALVGIDLSTNWTTGSPAITLETPASTDSRPAVSLGALWASDEGTLVLYGGEFSDSPNVSPPAQATWSYKIATKSWSIISTTGPAVSNVAEGSTTVVSNPGKASVGYYFSGHLDTHTTNGWSNQIARVYLNSLLAFDLTTSTYNNITAYSNSGNASTSTATPEIAPVYRADGTLTWVPNLGTNNEGLLVAIGGATESQYVSNQVLDVYDIGASAWTKQATQGFPLNSRVNHCAVRASAIVHGQEWHQIFIYGGQQLGQSDRDSALYVLTIPSFTWTEVGTNLPSQPTGRAGHACAIDGNQMIVIGGLVSKSLICDQPGIYVLNVSSLSWVNSFVPNSIYSTPSLVANITGGIGTGLSTSGSGSTSGGTGANGTDTSNNSDAPTTAPVGMSSSSSSSVGGIVGGVVGGILGLLALLLLVICLRKRRRNENLRMAAAEIVTPTTSPSLGEKESLSPHQRYSIQALDEDLEEQTMGMEASFGSHLVPKQTLRVTNPGEDS